MLRRLLSVVEHNATQPQIVNLFSVLSAEAGDPAHPAHDYFAERYVRLRAELEQALTRLAAAGELVPGNDPRALAVEIIALMDGLQVQWVLAPDRSTWSPCCGIDSPRPSPSRSTRTTQPRTTDTRSRGDPADQHDQRRGRPRPRRRPPDRR